MDEKFRHKRVMEDISHFFLSGDRPQKPSQEPGEKDQAGACDENDLISGADDKSTVVSPEKNGSELKVALPTAMAPESKESIVTAVKTYLRSANAGHLATVKNIGNPRFGAAELMLFDKKNFTVLCAMVQYGTSFSDFLVAAIGYYGWLNDCLQAGALFFNKPPRLEMYLFCARCPSIAPSVVEQLNAAMSIHLVRYHILQVPDCRAPIAYFQPLAPVNGDGGREKEIPDLSDDDWRHFNRLKGHVLEE